MSKGNSMSNLWNIVKQDLGWTGGTIHQVAKECNCDSSLLLASKDHPVEIRIGHKWFKGELEKLDGIPIDQNGNRWAKFSAHISGVNNHGTLTGLKGDDSIRIERKDNV